MNHSSGTVVSADYYAVPCSFATGNLSATIDDCQRWSRILVDLLIVSSVSLQEMVAPREGIVNAFGYGYGWVAAERYDQPCIISAGAVNGFNPAILLQGE